MNYYLYIPALIVLLVPYAVFGEVGKAPESFRDFVDIVTTVIGALVTLTVALTFVVFVWHIIKGFIIQSDNEEGIAQGKRMVVMGLISFVVLLTIWGLLSLLRLSLFGV